jgi:PAS domain S-box-containing protein
MSRLSADRKQPAQALSTKTMAEILLSDDLIEALPDAIVAVDRDGVIVQLNSQTQALFGYERDELIGQRIEILVPESYRREHHHHRENFAKTPKTRRMGANLDLSGRRRDGSEFPVEISLSPVSTEKGMFVLSAIRDISPRKRMEEELRRAHEELYQRTVEQLGEYRSRLALIIDSSEDAIIGQDLDGSITSWNKGAERIYGYAPEEVIGMNISLLVPPDEAANGLPDESSEILEKVARGEGIEHRCG